jgi:hypothetical protein
MAEGMSCGWKISVPLRHEGTDGVGKSVGWIAAVAVLQVNCPIGQNNINTTIEKSNEH